MSFYIYKNIPNKKVKIHTNTCGHCNDGNGVQRNVLGDANGYWTPEAGNGFMSYQSAAAVANELAAEMGINVSNCLMCNPHQ